MRSFFDNGGRRCYVTRMVGDGAAQAAVAVGGFTVTAIGPGAAYNNTWVRILPGSTRGADGNSVGFRLRLDYWANPADVPDAASTIGDAAIRPSVSEDFDDLSLDPASPSYYVKRANGFNSSLVQVSAADDAEAPIGDGVSGRLDGGTDGHPLTAADYEGDDADPVRRRGLKALELDRFREVAIVYAPGVDYDTARLVVTHCERIRFRLAVVDSLSGEANAVRIEPREQVTDTKYGAFYYPWIYVTDPRIGVRTKVPPGGPVCGIYALTDNTRGVFKAPANESLAGAVELEFDVNQGSQGILNARGVNVIRRFPGRGIRLGERGRCRATRCGSTSTSGGCSSSLRRRSTSPLSGWSSSLMTRGCGLGSSRRLPTSCGLCGSRVRCWASASRRRSPLRWAARR